VALRDPVLKRVISLVGPCTLQCHTDHFAVLVRSIISQQISSKAARSISARLEEALGRPGFRPKAILAASEETLQAAGLSASKRRSLRDLAERVHSGEVPLRKLKDLPDEEVIARLVPVYGIGRWTAEMFLIFALGRQDVLPLADLGLRVGVQRQYGLAERPTNAQLTELAEPWRPYRSVATWFFWRTFGAVPQSEAK
jgi:DNA-3-methyladenine glycosylase II